MRKTAWKVNRMRVVAGITLIMGLVLSGPSACKAVDAGYCASGDLVCDPLAWLFQQQPACSVLDSTNVTTYYDPVTAGDVTGLRSITADGAENIFFTDTASSANFLRLTSNKTVSTITTPAFVQAHDFVNDVLPRADSIYFVGIDSTTTSNTYIRNMAGQDYNSFSAPSTIGLIYSGNQFYFNVSSTVIGRMNPDFTSGGADIVPSNNANRLAPGPNGTFYFVDTSIHRIFQYNPATSSESVFAGNGSPAFLDGQGILAAFSSPQDIDTAPDGTIIVADSANNRIRAISPAGKVTTLAGDGIGTTTDGRGTAAQFTTPTGITVSPNCTIYVQEAAGIIRKMSP